MSAAEERPRLSAKERLIMELLLGGGGEQYGLQLVRNSEGGIPRGSVYVLLDRLEDKGFVTSRAEDRPPSTSGIARRLYKPTALGRRAVALLRRYDALFAETQAAW